MWSVPRLYNGSQFAALMSTESRTKKVGIQQTRKIQNWRIGSSSGELAVQGD
jgi:hypothetical protein